MGPDEFHILNLVETVPPDSPRLIGYEPQTGELDSESDDDLTHLATVARDALACGRQLLLARSDTGHLTLWQATHAFWLTPDSP